MECFIPFTEVISRNAKIPEIAFYLHSPHFFVKSFQIGECCRYRSLLFNQFYRYFGLAHYNKGKLLKQWLVL